MLKGLAMYAKYGALFLYPWDLASLAWMKNSGSQSDQILFDIPVVHLYDYSHPNEIPEKDCPFATDGERYCFTKQVRRDASGNRSQRKAGEKGAYWKSTSRDIGIKDLDEKLIGYMRKYALYEDKKRSSKWHMEEYRVLDPDGLVDTYVLCKIYHKDSFCPKYTQTSIRALTERIIKRQSQTKFDEDIIMQQPYENFPHELNLPTSGPSSDNNVFPMLQGLSNEFSMSRDPSGNLNPPESIQLIHSPSHYSNGFSTSHDAPGSQNPPESIAQIACLNSDDLLHEFYNSMDWTNNIHLNAPTGEESGYQNAPTGDRRITK